MSAPVLDQARLIAEARDLLPLVTGHGMHVSVTGDHLRALFARIDNPPAAVPPPAPPAAVPAWHMQLSGILRVVAEIVEDPAYSDLCGTNLVDALHAWAARNGTTVEPAALAAVDRALSGE